jgi:Carboxypeptidase regulatory-like domain
MKGQRLFKITALLVAVILPLQSLSVGNSFTQTSWSGGKTVNTATHTADQTNWNQYSATSTNMKVVNAGADLQLGTTTATVIQTNDGSTNTGFNLAGAATSSTEIVGTGSNADVRLTAGTSFGAYDIVDGTTGGANSIALALDSSNKAHIVNWYNQGIADPLAYQTNATSSTPWSSYKLDDGAFDISIAVDSNDKQHISYVSGANLKYATNATSSSFSYFTAYDSPSTSMQYTDIALDSNNKVHISFRDLGTGDLGYATNVSGTWATTSIDRSTASVGSWTSIAVDSNDKIHIAYQDVTSNRLKYATNATTSAWSTQNITSTAIGGVYISLALDSSNKAHVSFQTGNTSSINLRYATNATSTNWSTFTVDGTSTRPAHTSIGVDSADKVHITYQDTVAQDLWYATNETGSWVLSSLDTVDAVGTYSSMAVDSNDVVHVAYGDVTNSVIRYLTEAATYPSSGTYTSGPMSLGVGALSWGTLSWTSSGTGTITLKARSDADGDFSNATAWGSCTSITSGNALSTGGCVTNGHTYIQYQASLSTADTSVTPVLESVTIQYYTYATAQTLTSSIFNTESESTAIDSLVWTEDETLPANTSTVIELRAASTSAGITSATWYDFNRVTVNCTETDGTITCPASALPLAIKDGTDAQYVQYRVTLATTDGASTPTVSQVQVGYIRDVLVGPTVNTLEVSSPTSSSVTLNGNLTGLGGTDVTVRGFAYGTDSTLATVIATTTDTVGQPFSTGTFTHALTGLTCGTAYYVRAYATNTAGTGFGFDERFTLSCETAGGGGGSSSSGSGGGGGDSAPPRAPSAGDPTPAEEDPFRLPVFDHTERDRRFDPAHDPEPPEVSGPTPPAPDEESQEDIPTVPKVVQSVSRTVKTVAKASVTLIASTTEQIAPVVVPLGALSGTLAFAGSVIPFGGADLSLTFGRLWQALLSALGLRRRRPWGTVYDSVTKRPLDPAVIELVNELGSAVQTTYTDLEGRYGFLVVPGKYRLRVTKHDYQFPSRRLVGQTWEEVYGPTYLGEQITVDDTAATILYNIPLDPANLDFAAVARQNLKQYKYYSELRQGLEALSLWLYRAGFLLAGYTAVTDPAWESVGVLLAFAVIGFLHYAGFGPRPYGKIVEKSTGKPLAYALVTAREALSGEEVKRTITDEFGRYYALVPDGNYTVTVAKREIDGSYSPVYTSDAFQIRRSVVHRSFNI